MKSLVKIAIHGLALVGAHEIYKEYTSRKNSKLDAGVRLDGNPTHFSTFTS